MTQVQRLWSTSRRTGEWNLNITYGGDSPGYPFAIDPTGENLLLCNESQLFFFRVLENKLKFAWKLRAEEEGYWWGVAVNSQEAIALKSPCPKTENCLVRINLKTKSQKIVSTKRLPVAPPVRMFPIRADRILLVNGEEAYELRWEGDVLERYEAPYGAAVDSMGNVIIPQKEEPMPRVVRAKNGELIGIDQQNRFYWLVSDYQHKRIFSYFVDKLIVSTKDGSVVKGLPLNGERGIIRFLREESQIGWVSVDLRGEVYVLGWRWRSSRNAVGLWRLRWGA